MHLTPSQRSLFDVALSPREYLSTITYLSLLWGGELGLLHSPVGRWAASLSGLPK